MRAIIRFVFCLAPTVFAFATTNAQQLYRVKGTIFKADTTQRAEGVTVYNKRTFEVVKTNSKGIFELQAVKGDTLDISFNGYDRQDHIISSFKDIAVFLKPPILLPEVSIKSVSAQNELKAIEQAYKSKGIYYHGRPPLSLLSPFGGKPLTFFYELLSKDGRQARRFGRFAESEGDYLSVSRRFNDYTIKQIVNIADSSLIKFKIRYRPTVEQLNKWSDFDLLLYIKKSYADFQKSAKIREYFSGQPANN